MISFTTARTNIQSAAGIFGEYVLGFAPSDIGTHSIRLGSAIHMYLSQVPTLSIMMIGLWSRDAFLQYIRKQVEKFSHNVYSRMIMNTFALISLKKDDKPTPSASTTFVFYVKGRQVPHSHLRLALSDTVTITFEFQKSNEQHESFTMYCSGCRVLCTVLSWAYIV